ncbi:hypothetical protein Cni_G29440 [Canna indica]|uniref:Uncharacterized protein n=1 Tax=Canna indica TaxID=4628 RepID=A0AAQ3L5F4_9LILI|nr:hypothetical protein Cni_G29440 [Canna indica]
MKREEKNLPNLTCPNLGVDLVISSVREDSPKFISAAPRPSEPPPHDGGDEEDADFEFAFVLSDPENCGELIDADDIFSEGRIRPLHPVFVDGPIDRDHIRRLLGKEPHRKDGEDSASTSPGVDELASLDPRTYCGWAPGEAPRCKKSSSTGSLRRWRLRDLVAKRCQSHGKDKFVFLAADERRGREEEKDANPLIPRGDSKGSTAETEMEDKKGKKKTTKMVGKGGGEKRCEGGACDMVTAHRLYYAKEGGEQAKKRGARRSFLPYKQNVVGLFANRTYHPG